jgi:hypothetical protein
MPSPLKSIGIAAAFVCAVLSASAQKSDTYVAVVNGDDVHVSGNIMLVNEGIATSGGAKIEASKHNAAIMLTRGGEIALCQYSSISVDARGSQLMMALQPGVIEARYPLSAGADTLLTPDYRITVKSGTNVPGQMAFYRIGLGTHGDLLVHVLPKSDAHIDVSSNFDSAAMTVSPGEMKAFPAFGSSVTPQQIMATMAVRCPVEEDPQRRSLTASAQDETPDLEAKNGFNVPLAYRPEPATHTVDQSAVTVAEANAAAAIAAQNAAINAAMATTKPPEPQPTPVASFIALLPETKHQGGMFHSLAHFFQRMFGGKAKTA